MAELIPSFGETDSEGIRPPFKTRDKRQLLRVTGVETAGELLEALT